MNPCRCGHFAELACGRAPRCAEDYQGRLSGPLLDRIDLHIDVPAVPPADLALPPAAEGSAAVASRVMAARARQAKRYAGLAAGRGVRTNAEADGALLDEVATPEPAGRTLLARAAERLRLSARGYHRVFARRAHPGRPRRRPRCCPLPRRGGAELPPEENAAGSRHAARLMGATLCTRYHAFFHAVHALRHGTDACYDPLPL